MKELFFVRIDCNSFNWKLLLRYLELFVLLKIICEKKSEHALLKKGVHSSVILPDEDKHTQKNVSAESDTWENYLGRGHYAHLQMTGFFSYFVWKSKLYKAQWKNGKELFL